MKGVGGLNGWRWIFIMVSLELVGEVRGIQLDDTMADPRS